MFDNEVATALCAIATLADVTALKSSEKLLALGHFEIFLLPQSKGAHWRGGIMPAVLAVTVAHLQRIAAHLNLYGSAITLTHKRLCHRLFDITQTRRGLQACCSGALLSAVTEISAVIDRRYRAFYVERARLFWVVLRQCLRLVRPNRNKFPLIRCAKCAG